MADGASHKQVPLDSGAKDSGLQEIRWDDVPRDERRAPFYLVVLQFCVPLLIFLAFFDPNILNPTHVGWLLDGDWGQHFLGWHALRQTPMAWPYNHQHLLADPTGLSTIYTDSNPLLALPLRLISRLLPQHFQYIGPWLFVCVMLQYTVAFVWLRRHAPNIWAATAGAALMTLLPTLFNRIGHDTLCAHWLILATLFVFFEIRDEKRKWLSYAGILFVSGLVHPYILFMNLAIWAGDQGRLIIPALRSRLWKKAGTDVAQSLLTLIPMVAALAAGGAFSGQSAAGDGFGVYGMTLDAPFNPGRDGFALAFLKGPQPPQMQFEGFQYLGMGLLVLLGAALWLRRAASKPSADTDSGLRGRMKVLKWPLIVLTTLAVSDHIVIYSVKLLDLSFPGPVVDLLNIVRASGRLFWPVSYCLVFLALVQVYEAPQRLRNGILCTALILQALDLYGFSRDVHGLTEPAAKPAAFSVATNTGWDGLMTRARRVVFEAPILGNDHRPFYEVILHALDHRRPVNMMYSARENAAQDALERREYLDFVAGKIDPSELYVILNKSVPQSLAGRVRDLDGIWIIPPLGAEALAPKPAAIPPFQFDHDYDLGYNTPTGAWFGADWAIPNIDSMASLGDRAGFVLPVVQPAGQALRLTMNVRGRRKGQHIQIYSAGHLLDDAEVGKKGRDLTVVLPASTTALPVALTLAGVVTPDDRRHGKTGGIQIYRLRLSAAR